jgi:hypothetical protein
VKRSGRDESMWAVIHMCMETVQGISLYSYLHLKLAKMLCFPFYLIYFFLQQNQRIRGQNRFYPEGWGKVAKTMYTHVSKCKNDKIKSFLMRKRYE